MKKILLLTTILLFGFVACAKDDESTIHNVSVTSVTLNHNMVVLAVDKTVTLVATVLPENAINRNVIWTSSDTSVATVNSNGEVIAVAVGMATISATAVDGGQTATSTVYVARNAPPGQVTGVKMNRAEINLVVGASESLIAHISTNVAFPGGSPYTHVVTWTSSNPAVATINPAGTMVRVTAVSTGTSTITATTEDGEFTTTSTVMVKEVNISSSLGGVVIDGVRWATRNVDRPGAFARSPEEAGMFYQWNRRIGWSSTDPIVNSNGGTTWDSSTPAGTSWERANDPCPAGWRVPTRAELISLNGADKGWITYNDVNGRVFGIAPNQIFIPVTGVRNGMTSGTLELVGSIGFYWGNTRSPQWWGAEGLPIGTANSGVGDGVGALYHRSGHSVRCVSINN